MKRIAIIGGGIAGTMAAYLFQKNYQVTLYEKNNYVGGNNQSVDIGEGVKVPLVVIIFAGKHSFGETIKLAKNLGLKVENKVISHAFLNEGKLVYDFYPSMFRLINNFKCVSLSSLIKDFWYFLTEFKELDSSKGKVVKDLINEQKFSRDFVEVFLVPLACLYLLLPYKRILEMPLEIFADWYKKYLITSLAAPFQFSYVKNGNHQIIDQLILKTQLDLRLKSKVEKVIRKKQKVEIYADGQKSVFDKVIFASPPKEIINILNEPTEAEKNILGNIKYTDINCILHTDSSKALHNTITLNLVDHHKNGPSVVTTYSEDCFNYRLKNKKFVTVEKPGINSIKPEHILYKKKFFVPETSQDTFEKVSMLNQLNDNQLNSYFCGSYFRKYFYHEDAIYSAMKIKELDNSKSKILN